MCAVELSLKVVFYTGADAILPSGRSVPDSYAIQMWPDKAQTAILGCHCPGYMAGTGGAVGWCPNVSLAWSVCSYFSRSSLKFTYNETDTYLARGPRSGSLELSSPG